MRGGSDGKIPPCKHEDLSLVPKAHIKKLGGVANDFNPSSGEAEISRLLRLWASSLGSVVAPGLRESLSQVTDF